MYSGVGVVKRPWARRRAVAVSRSGPPGKVVLRAENGALLPLDPSRWHLAPTAAERRLLASLAGPVLDVGCGPGRILEGLAMQGVVALGVDPASRAVALARQRGCAVLQRSVFERLPGEGRWAGVLLLDGNVGIGGDPRRLLRRCSSLLRPRGVIIAEVEAPGAGWQSFRARLERGPEAGAWFHWSVVGADAIPRLAGMAGLQLESVEASSDDRWFARLIRESGRADACA